MVSAVDALLQKMLAYSADRAEIRESEIVVLLTRTGPVALGAELASPERFDEMVRDVAKRQPSFSDRREAVFLWTFEDRRFVVSGKEKIGDDERGLVFTLTADHSTASVGRPSESEEVTRYSARGVAGQPPSIEIAGRNDFERPAAGPTPPRTSTQPVPTFDRPPVFKKPSDESFPDVAMPRAEYRGIDEPDAEAVEIPDPMLHRRGDPTPSPLPMREFQSTRGLVSPYVAADGAAARTALWSGLASGIVFAVAAAAAAPRGSAFGAAFNFSVRSLAFSTITGFLFFWSMTSLFYRMRRQSAVGRISEDGILDEAVNVLARESLTAIAARFDRPAAKANPLALRAQALIRQWENRRGLVEAHQALERQMNAEERERDAAFFLPQSCAAALPWIGVVGALLFFAIAFVNSRREAAPTFESLAFDLSGGCVQLALAAGFAAVIKFAAAILRAEDTARCLRAHDRIVDVLLPALESRHPTDDGRLKKERRLDEELVGSMQKIAAYLKGKEDSRDVEHERR